MVDSKGALKRRPSGASLATRLDGINCRRKRSDAGTYNNKVEPTAATTKKSRLLAALFFVMCDKEDSKGALLAIRLDDINC